ncbi:MAG TPA: hypothetical protein VE076_00955, partial [Nitrososphaeraceae archaeon]|nr:hypothetical protein [Nitrososphaeraceae archaeon]
MSSHSNSSSIKEFVYFPHEELDQQQKRNEGHGDWSISDDIIDKLLNATGREILREKTPNLWELEQTLQDVMSTHYKQSEKGKQQKKNGQNTDTKGAGVQMSGMPIITQLIKKGYLKDSEKWLSARGFIDIGRKILNDVMKALKTGDFGTHTTTNLGSGSLVLDTNKKYEPGDDIRLINVPSSLLNTVQRVSKKGSQIKIPLDIDIEDIEEYEMMQDVRVALVYCIDLSSTMRYSSMFEDMSRIEAAKRALWSLFLLNRKF